MKKIMKWWNENINTKYTKHYCNFKINANSNRKFNSNLHFRLPGRGGRGEWGQIKGGSNKWTLAFEGLLTYVYGRELYHIDQLWNVSKLLNYKFTAFPEN